MRGISGTDPRPTDDEDLDHFFGGLLEGLTDQDAAAALWAVARHFRRVELVPEPLPQIAGVIDFHSGMYLRLADVIRDDGKVELDSSQIHHLLESVARGAADRVHQLVEAHPHLVHDLKARGVAR